MANEASLVKGIVVSSFKDDPDLAGRVQVYIPSVHGKFNSDKVGTDVIEEEREEEETIIEKYPWAQCITSMGIYSVPKVGATVWITFETNNPRLPVVVGLHTAGLNINDDEVFSGGNADGSGEQGTGIAGGTLAEIAAKVIFGNEGGYTSVNWNDNGAISIGKIQWHANNARNLLKDIKSKNVSKFTSTAPLVNAALDFSWSNWKNWSSGSSAGKQLVAVLGTEESKQVQDETAISYVQGYLNKIEANGVKNPQSAIYLADIANQGPAIGYAFAKYASTTGATTLDKVHKNTMEYRPYRSKYINGDNAYRSRRTRTYNKIKELEGQGIFTENGLTNMSGSTGKGTIGWPVPGNGSVTSKFGYRNISISSGFHPGIDIGCSSGTKLYAAHDGTIRQNTSGPWGGGLGNSAVIDGGSVGYSTLYAHMSSKIQVPEGSHVKRGQFIGYSGNTGNSTGPHLHWGVYKGEKYRGYGKNDPDHLGAVDPLSVSQKP